MLTVQTQLASTAVGEGDLSRLLATVGSEPVVLFQKTHAILQPKFSDEAWATFASQVRLTDALQAELDQWNRHDRFSFNCHTLAIGRYLGIGPEYWLEGSSSVFTLMENPTQSLLDVYFQEVDRTTQLDNLEDRLHPNDIVVFRHAHTGDLSHSGVVREVDGRPVVLSKLGEHPVAVTSIDALTTEYRGQFDSFHLFRPKPELIGRPLPSRSSRRRLQLLTEA